jgi:hypothetical protein
MVKTFVMLSVICVAVSACSHTQDQKPNQVTSVEAVACRMETRTGSNMPRRVCTTEAERARKEEEARSMVDRTQRSRAIEDAATLGR